MRRKYRIDFGNPVVDEETKLAIKEVVDSEWLSEGPRVRRFEEEWGNKFGYKHNAAMNSGTSADIAACASLESRGAQPGDEIISPALAFVAVGNSIRAAGFKPVFVDVEPTTMNINPDKIEEKITSKTRAIMAVHTMGKPCDMDSIMEIAKNHNLAVIEDSCESHGAQYKGKYIGSFGDIATFSFYAAHLVWAVEGGMASTNNPDLHLALQSARNHGREPGNLYFQHDRFGLNLRMIDLTASIALTDLKKFDKTFKKRKENLHYLLDATKSLQEYAIFNIEEEHEIVAPHAFSVLMKDKVKANGKDLIDFLEERGIQTKRNFGSMPTQHKSFAYLGHKLGEFPAAEYIGDKGVHFGIHQKLTKKDLDYAAETLHDYFRRFK